MTFWPKLLLAIFILTWSTPTLAGELALPEGLTTLALDAALNDAAKNKKTVMIYFWADWCPSCRRFNADTLPDKNILNALAASYSVVSASNVHDPDNLAQKFQIRAFPTFLFLNHQGELITVLPGAVETKIFALVLEYISSGSYQNIDFDDFVKLKS
jgi:thioredoxin-related protein